MSAARILDCALLFSIVACIGPPPARDVADAGVAAPLVRAFAATGEPLALDQLTRRPLLVIETSPPLAADAEPLLFSGSLDATLQADLERSPLTSLDRARLIDCATSAAGGATQLSPMGELQRAAEYTLALPSAALPSALRAALGGAWTQPLHVADSVEAGASVRAMWPEPDSQNVPCQLREVLLSLDGSADFDPDSAWLEDDVGQAFPAELREVGCRAIDSDGDACLALAPGKTLAPGTHYTVRTGRSLRDAQGASLEPYTRSFTTSPDPAAADSGWQTPACAIDETALPVGCALLGEDRITLRSQVSGTTRVVISLGSRELAQLPVSDAVELTFDRLGADTAYQFEVTRIDALERAVVTSFELSTTPPLATLSISEVRADPLGREPAQEYVELLNFGAQPLPLAGIALSSVASELGQAVQDSRLLPAGARALLVADSFDPNDPADPAPAPGTLLVHVGNALAGNGLPNRGAPLYLRDAANHRLSGAPNLPVPRPGVCSVRVAADPRSQAPGSFAYDPNGTCTPGR
jgi:hypothetical protein